MESSHTLELSIPAERASLAQVRRKVRAFLAEHEVREDKRNPAVLVTHELAANAIVHGSADDSGSVSITLELEPRSLIIRVLDPAHSETGPAALEPTSWRESGRGMLMVARLATWSDRLIGGRREVRAELRLLP